MHFTKKTVILIVAAVLILAVLATVAANRSLSGEPVEANDPSDSTNEYTPEQAVENADSAEDGNQPGGEFSNIARLTEESHNESFAPELFWPDGVNGNQSYSYNRATSSEPEPADGAEPDKQALEQDETYSLSLTVLDGNGYPIRGAEVMVGEETILTDATGSATVKTTNPEMELIVAASGYVSYYEELDLTDHYLPLTVVMDDASHIRMLLNSAELRPFRTDNADLEDFLNVLCDELFRPGMDTYDKVKACYDWLVDNTYYKSPNHWDTAKNYWLCAYQCMVDGYGTCNCYSAAFTAMMRHIGLECYVVTGYTTANEGGYTSHDWTTVCINDEWYIFDPQVEDAIANRTRSKEVTYIRFCLAEPHAKYRYSIISRANAVKKFETYMNAHGSFLTD